MKSLIAFLVSLSLALSLSAAETTPKKKEPEKPSAKVEALAKTLTAEERARLLTLLNQGDMAALMAIPGIGEVRAKAIQDVRPFTDVTDVIRANGVGEGLLAQMIAYAKAGFVQPPNKAPAKKKPAPERTGPLVPRQPPRRPLAALLHLRL